jgi:hypothetical protein
MDRRFMMRVGADSQALGWRYSSLTRPRPVARHARARCSPPSIAAQCRNHAKGALSTGVVVDATENSGRIAAVHARAAVSFSWQAPHRGVGAHLRSDRLRQGAHAASDWRVAMCAQKPDDPDTRVLGEVPAAASGGQDACRFHRAGQAKSDETRAFWEQNERRARESRLGVPGELIAYYTRAATVFRTRPTEAPTSLELVRPESDPCTRKRAPCSRSFPTSEFRGSRENGMSKRTHVQRKRFAVAERRGAHRHSRSPTGQKTR